MSEQFPIHLGAQVDKAAEFCTYCPRLCRFACPIAEVEHREGTTPWGLMRLLEYARQGTVDFDDEVSQMFYHCTGCGRCQSVCKHDIDVPRAVWKARSLGFQSGNSPELLDGFVSFFKTETIPHRKVTTLDPNRIAEVFDVDANVAFFPDCETRRYRPDLVFRIGMALEIALGHKVHLSTRLGEKGTGCCGFPLGSAGDVESMKTHCADLQYQHLGFDRIYTDCASFFALGVDDKFGAKVETELSYLPAFFAGVLSEEHIKTPVQLDGSFLHDSCFSTRHAGSADETRSLLSLIANDDILEFSSNREDAPCCGGASHYHVIAEDFSEQCASDRVEQLTREGGNKMVTACQTCVKQLGRVGAEVQPLLSLVCDAMGIERVVE